MKGVFNKIVICFFLTLCTLVSKANGQPCTSSQMEWFGKQVTVVIKSAALFSAEAMDNKLETSGTVNVEIDTVEKSYHYTVLESTGSAVLDADMLNASKQIERVPLNECFLHSKKINLKAPYIIKLKPK